MLVLRWRLHVSDRPVLLGEREDGEERCLGGPWDSKVDARTCAVLVVRLPGNAGKRMSVSQASISGTWATESGDSGGEEKQ